MTEITIGSVVRHYDGMTDSFRNGEVMHIEGEWVLVSRPPDRPDRPPFACVAMKTLKIADTSPLSVGDAVGTSVFGAHPPRSGVIVAIDGAQAWVRWPQGDSVEPLDRLERTP